MVQYENYEWSRFWCQKTNDYTHPRILLIGDSITEGFHSELNQLMDGILNADAFVTSMGLNHESFCKGIQWFTDAFRNDYSAVHFSNGLHAFDMTKGEYEAAYYQTVEYLLDSFPTARLILATSTPVYLPGKERIIDPKKNSIVIERNQVIANIAQEMNLTIDDLYGYTLGNDDWRSDDGFHYNEIGRRKQAEKVSFILKTILEKDELEG